jgi:LacI family transcriptional regulator
LAVTLKDIALKVGKSVTTVSRALHGYDDVSPETKELVRQVALDMGYFPSSFAQGLQKQKTDTIGFVLPTYGPRFTDPFFSEFLAGVGNKAGTLGYDILVSTCPPGDQELLTYQHKVQTRRVDGFIIVRTRRQDLRINYLCQVGFPFVAFGRIEAPCDFPHVDEDSEYGMRLIIDHLANRGYKRIGFLAAPHDLMFAALRMNGFIEGLKVHNLPLEESLIVTGDLTQRGGYAKTKVLLDLPDPPDAIVASNDLMAIGAIRAVQERGLRVGMDIAITGFDDTTMSEHTHPPLTTVNQPVYQIGGMVTEMLIKRIQGVTLDYEKILLMPSLIIRQSCGENAPH